ncbi:MAG: MFS transporter [Pseudomonadota bacterium]
MKIANATEQPWPSPVLGWYATIMLMIAYTFSFVDRQVLNLLVEPIRADLGLSDTQISFLQGLAFVGAYVLMSIPIGRLVDRVNRIAVLVGGVVVWSLATVGCGMANSYSQLVVARMGVGAGESSVTPSAWSILADYFPREKLAGPVSVFLIGPYLGAGIALIAGAEVIDWSSNMESIAVPLLGEVAPWQFTFIAVGLPGILLSLLLLTVPEPKRRGRLADGETVQRTAPPWPVVIAYMREHWRIYFAFLVGMPFVIVLLYGLQAWVPTFLVRVYDWSIPQAGRVYGTIALLAGSAGVLSGPFVARWLSARGYTDYPLRIPAVAVTLAGLCAVPASLQSNPTIALVLIAGASFFVTVPMSLVTAALQTVTPNEMRGVVAGMFVVMGNVIGLALGPTVVALLTDRVFADPLAVGKSLSLLFAIIAPLAVLLLVSGMRPFRETIESFDEA